eukprot:scaffold18038_cov155-Skeletonema_marinoi.AAC.2
MGGTQSSQSDPTTTVAVTGTGCSGGPRPIPKNFTLLHGCFTMEEHEHKIAADVAIAKGLKGKDALSALGFEFRFVPCDLHMEGMNDSSPDEAEEDRHTKQPSTKLSRKASCASFLSLSDESYGSGQRYQCCHDCATRLFYICGSSAETTDESSPPSDASTMITLSNPKSNVAGKFVRQRK